MIHGYHLILPMYGFWLPNDPRGSWSDYIRRWELACFGRALKSIEKQDLTELTPMELAERKAAKKSLKYPAVSITGTQAATIGRGFAKQAQKSNYTIWACAILPEHTHLVLARHTYKVEQMANLLKGAATTQMIDGNNHPMKEYTQSGKRPPRMWSSREWKVYLDTEEAVEQAIHYVEENPIKENKPRQTWSFVTPFAGITTAGWTTYH
jgi:REP element-mobilizing transposase RayT